MNREKSQLEKIIKMHKEMQEEVDRAQSTAVVTDTTP